MPNIIGVSRASSGIVTAAALCACLTFSSCALPLDAGMVSGHLLLRSGPPGTPDQPIAGSVIIGTPTIGHYGAWIPVIGSGTFRVFVNTGTYPMMGHSPSFGNGKLTCYSSPRTVTVTKAATTVRDVVCNERQ
jgi:hypothetical protein